MSSMTDEDLLAARLKIKETHNFYWKISQEPNVDLTRPRGRSAQANCDAINKVGLALKAEITKRNLNIN